MGGEKSRLRQAISRWASTSDQHTRDLRRTHGRGTSTTVAAAQDRDQVRVEGTIRTITLRPRGGVPALEAELEDGTGVITLIWLGRRSIAGINPGRTMFVQGRLGVQDGVRMIYNPRYQLTP